MAEEKEQSSSSSERLSAAFDALWFCYSPVHQMQQYYRLGVLDNCSEKWNTLMNCFLLKTKKSSEIQGRFEILTLAGSFTFGETTNSHPKIGMLSVSLAKPDGRVFGGSVVGSLIASGPIQLIIVSFKQNISKEMKLRQFPMQITETTEAEENGINGESENQEIITKSDSQNAIQQTVSSSDHRASPDNNSQSQIVGSSDNNNN